MLERSGHLKMNKSEPLKTSPQVGLKLNALTDDEWGILEEAMTQDCLEQLNRMAYEQRR